MRSIVEKKSFELAVRIVRMSRYLRKRGAEPPIIEQILRSGTSIGANISEAQNAQSKRDFLSKMQIALKEATETQYWIRLLKEVESMNEKEYESLMKDCDEVTKMLISIVKTTREKEK